MSNLMTGAVFVLLMFFLLHVCFAVEELRKVKRRAKLDVDTHFGHANKIYPNRHKDGYQPHPVYRVIFRA